MYFDDLKLGMAVDTAPATIEKDKMLAFAVEYDNIPLHTDEEYAKSTPFGTIEYNRRIYHDTAENKHIFLLDEAISP